MYAACREYYTYTPVPQSSSLHKLTFLRGVAGLAGISCFLREDAGDLEDILANSFILTTAESFSILGIL